MSYESEKRTRTERIDPELTWAGWQIVDFDPRRPLTAYDRCAVREYPTEDGPADYALCAYSDEIGIDSATKWH